VNRGNSDGSFPNILSQLDEFMLPSTQALSSATTATAANGERHQQHVGGPMAIRDNKNGQLLGDLNDLDPLGGLGGLIEVAGASQESDVHTDKDKYSASVPVSVSTITRTLPSLDAWLSSQPNIHLPSEHQHHTCTSTNSLPVQTSGSFARSESAPTLESSRCNPDDSVHRSSIGKGSADHNHNSKDDAALAVTAVHAADARKTSKKKSGECVRRNQKSHEDTHSSVGGDGETER
jgi:hypothetical protein